MLETRISWISGEGTAQSGGAITASDARLAQRAILERHLPAAKQVLVERLDENQVLAACVTIVDEVTRWNPDTHVIPGPAAWPPRDRHTAKPAANRTTLDRRVLEGPDEVVGFA